jgi:acylphosphatase
MLVSGRVQGVWFRESCRLEAQRLAVAGWAGNRPDGRVEIEAEGAEEAVVALEAWAGEGPPHARVTGVEIEELEPLGVTEFEVR